ncbi:10514_t:CDS:2, partial [Racocetra fulgida]
KKGIKTSIQVMNIKNELMKNGVDNVRNNRDINIINVKDTERRSPEREHIPNTQAINNKWPKNLDPKIDNVDETAKSVVDIKCIDDGECIKENSKHYKIHVMMIDDEELAFMIETKKEVKKDKTMVDNKGKVDNKEGGLVK